MKSLKYTIIVVFAIFIIFSNMHADNKSLRIISGGKYIAYLPIDVAKELNYFGQSKINPEIIVVRGGTNQAISLISREGDFALLGVEHAIKAQLQGKQLVLLGVIGKTPTQILVASVKSGIVTPADLVGKKVTVSSFGSLGHMMLLSILEKYSVDASKIEIIAMDYAAAATAMDQGSVDASILIDPLASQFIESGRGKIIYNLLTSEGVRNLFGMDHPSSVLMTTKDFYEKNTALCTNVLDALIEANKWILATPPEKIAEIMSPDVIGNKEQFIKGLKNSIDYFTSNPQITPEMVELVKKSMIKVGALKNDIDVKQLFPQNNSFMWSLLSAVIIVATIGLVLIIRKRKTI